MKNILLTGSTGFIGKNINEQLYGTYNIFAPVSNDLELLDFAQVSSYILNNKIDIIIHCATINQKRREQQVNELDVNLRMFFNLAACSVEKMIYMGSGAEYDKRKNIADVKETDINNIPLLNDYGLSKYIMNMSTKQINHIINMRLFGVYGKYENEDACFPSHLCKSVLYKDEIVIRQNCVFDFCYIDDVIKVLLWLIENNSKYQDYNICSGRKVSLFEMAQYVNEIGNKSLPIRFLNEGMGLEYTGNNSRILAEVPIQFTDIKVGLEKLYTFYKQKER